MQLLPRDAVLLRYMLWPCLSIRPSVTSLEPVWVPGL